MTTKLTEKQRKKILDYLKTKYQFRIAVQENIEKKLKSYLKNLEDIQL